jgi:hypothetical protein
LPATCCLWSVVRGPIGEKKSLVVISQLSGGIISDYG